MYVVWCMGLSISGVVYEACVWGVVHGAWCMGRGVWGMVFGNWCKGRGIRDNAGDYV